MEANKTNSEKDSYLTFSLANLRFGVKALNVMELFYLPELTPLEEMPDYIAGVMNLRGKIVPVIDLNLRFRRQRERYRITDRVITITNDKGILTGIIVNDIHEVETIPLSATEPISALGQTREHLSSFISNLAKMGSTIIMILDIDIVLPYSEAVESGDSDEETNALRGERLAFCPEASPEEMEVFRNRARDLMAKSGSENLAETISVAVAEISGEYYGFELSFIKEFTAIHQATPIPCCPQHIIGNMNLRGNILTIMDIKPLLDLESTPEKTHPKVIVVYSEGIIVGLAVDDILDIIHIHPSEMVQSPSGLREGKEKYVIGTAPFEGRVISIINISEILNEPELAVEEEI